MFDLKTASIGIRKACAWRGIRTASLQFIYEGNYRVTFMYYCTNYHNMVR